MNKVYLENINKLIEASQNKEQVFIEYRDRLEKIDDSDLFGESDWLFTLKVLPGVRYFKEQK
jgi:hypothetical protein